MFGLKEKIPFGKHKGQVVEDILKRDLQYINWLRAEKRKSFENLLDKEADKAFMDQWNLLTKKQKSGNTNPAARLTDEEIQKRMDNTLRDLKYSMADEKQRAKMIQEENATREAVYKENWGQW